MSYRKEALIIALIWALFFSWVNVLGRWEARLLPVIDNVSIELYDRKDGKTDLWINFTKERKCSYQDTEFFLIDRIDNVEYSTKIDGNFEGVEKVRVDGPQRSGEYVINAKKDDIKILDIITTHKCHSGFSTISMHRYEDGVVTKQ